MAQPASALASAAVTNGKVQRVKPRMRGVLHQHAAFAAAAAGAVLVAAAPTARAALASLVYAGSLVMLLSVSATYHVPQWSARTRDYLGRLDHSSIFILIAGSYTPFCLLGMPGAAGKQLLATVWAGAAAGILQSVFWASAPAMLKTGLFLLLGWTIVLFKVEEASPLSGWGISLIAAGGVAYSIGAVIYAMKAPDPWPKTFGYHEIFHALVIVASILHFAAVTALVLSQQPA